MSFLAYGTHRWGVNVACGDLDGDGIDEIVTGPGPGAVFGPHVRGWNYDGTALTAIPGVSFLALRHAQVRRERGLRRTWTATGSTRSSPAPGPARPSPPTCGASTTTGWP